ncbi:MAG: segregation/condensation protein A [[Clostridium] leptum]
MEYDRVFEDSREKSELVATFLAVLELVKGKRVRIEEESTTRKLKLLGGGGKVWRSRSTKQS